jgi:antitoxin Phd
VTVRGKDAVFVVSAEQFAALVPSTVQPSLHVLLSTSPLRDLDVKSEGQAMHVRDVSL